MTFTIEQIQMLAEAERAMDRGEVPFVINAGERMMVDPRVMTDFKLETGQTVTNAIVIQILERQIQYLEEEIALEDLSK